MKNDLISRQTVIDRLNEAASKKGLGAAIASLIIQLIQTIPVVEATPVVHGRWIYHECVSSHDGAISGYSCSECGAFVNEEIFDMDEFHKDFCGHCGAKMDQE